MNGSRITGRRRLALLVAASVIATAACGSTAQNSGESLLGAGTAASSGGSGTGGGDGLGGPGPGDEQLTTGGVPDAGAPAVAGTGGGSAAGGTTPVPGAGSGGAAQGPAAGGAGAGTGTSPGAPVGPGVTATEIALGIPYCNDCASGNAALGAGGQDPGDTRRYMRAALDDVNARGGVLGRKLVPVFHEISVSDNIDVSAQEACSTFTEDNKVLMMFFRGEISYECARKAGIVVSGSGGSGPMFERYPNLFAPATIRLERLGAVTVKAMVNAGWHKPEPKWPTGKIGLITWEDTEYEYAMNNGYLLALREAGLKETEVRYVAVPQNANALADASAAISSAVLSFQQQGIDHVFIADGPAGIFVGTGLTLLFLNTAKSQRYYPRYGFNSNNSPGWENLPADQQVGMLAIDSFDTEAINDEGIELNPQRERCWDLMRKRGLPVGDAQTGSLAIGACDIAWFAEAVLARAKGTTLPEVVAAGEALGSSYRSPYNYGNRIGPGQRDGVALFRTARFDEACSCMRYTSKPFEP